MRNFKIGLMRSLLGMIILSLALSVAFAQDAKTKGEKKFDGKSIFAERKCSGCHSIESAGFPKKSSGAKGGPPDLSTVGSKHDAAWMSKFLQKNETLNGKKHMIKFGGTDDELKALTQWLGAMKEGGKKEK